MVSLAGGTAVHVERDAELLERFLDHAMVTVYHILWSNALLTCTNGNGYTMFIATANEHHFFLFQSEITYVNVGWNIDTSQMTDVYTAISIGQCRRNGCSLEFFLCHYSFF